MAAAAEGHLSRIVHFGSAVIALPGKGGQGAEDIKLCQDRGGGPQPLGRGRNRIAQFEIQCVLHVVGLLVGLQHFLFMLFQFGRDVPLGIFERLLADVRLGNLVAVSVGHLEVVTEHPVVSDLEVRNA